MLLRGRSDTDMNCLLIADDHGLYREGLATLVRDSLGVERVIEAATLDDTIEALSSDPGIECLLIDLNMPGMHGVASLARIKERQKNARIVVISASDHREDVLGALAHGAHGYVWKGSDNDEIARALNAVMSGTIYVPSFLAAAPADEQREDDRPAIDLSRFTPRQAEVLTLLAKGLSNKQIARELNLAESTVKIHVAAIFREVGAHNRTQAVVLAQKLATPV
jgi:DNA-binding NarL/FixJ family response regulator